MNTEKEWLVNNRLYTSLDETRLTSIFFFPLIWNLFEKNLCNGFAQINTHAPEIANRYEDKITELSSIWRYFQSRYVQDGKTTSNFKSFKFSRVDKKDEVERMLIADSTSSNRDKMEALLRIAFRLRNNLYHGEKDVSQLYDQNENFRQINILLMALVDANKGVTHE